MSDGPRQAIQRRRKSAHTPIQRELLASYRPPLLVKAIDAGRHFPSMRRLLQRIRFGRIVAMKIPAFDEFVAIDWSGATDSYSGIAVAACEAGQGAPVLLGPGGRRGTRTRNCKMVWYEAGGAKRGLSR